MNTINRARRVLITAGLVGAAGAGLAVQASAAQAVAPHASAAAVSPSSATLKVGPAPTTFNSSQRATRLGDVSDTGGATFTVNVTTGARYSVELTNILPSVDAVVVDGASLKSVSLDFYDRQWSQSFYVSAGSHTIRVAPSSADAPVTAWLFGTL